MSIKTDNTQTLVNALAEIERLRGRCAELEEGLSELVSIVDIHSSATSNNFAWAENAFAKELLAKHQSGNGSVETKDSLDCGEHGCLAFYEERRGWSCACRLPRQSNATGKGDSNE